ncbi:hypothetical protein K2173_025399 [Erythroxylum novogranatense]|uniref:Zinc-ribbon domain-containing protein n=1 Tax=Erythroxylum novogranatense TaxID=1862640 RepID=A0AAV8UHE0_9ROSI|nr:hypothetical protein K2173_025399 [Erythroxylum novogranatense]
MAESSEVRLVRCPKCENLLPELPDYPIYECGGCGTVLRAKIKNQDQDMLPEKSDGEKVVGSADKLQDSLKKEIVASDYASVADVHSTNLNKDDANHEERCRKESMSDNCKLVDENGVGSPDMDLNMAGSSHVVGREKSSGKGVDMQMNKDDASDVVGRDRGALNPKIGFKSGHRRSGPISGWKSGEGGEIGGFERIMRTEVEGVRFSTSKYLDEGPSNYNLDTPYCPGELLRNHDHHDGTNRIQYLEKDRVELLKKLDELKEKLSRSCDVANKAKEKVPLNRRMAPADSYGGTSTWIPGGSSVPDKVMQSFAPDNNVPEAPFFSHQPEPFPYTDGHGMATNSFCPSIHKSDHVPRFGDPFGAQVLERAQHHLPRGYRQHPNQYYSANYFENNPGPFETYPPNANFHQPHCSCFYCCDKHHGVSVPAPPPTCCNNRFPDLTNNPLLYRQDNSPSFSPHVYNLANTVPLALNLRASQTHTRWPSDINLQTGDFVRRRPRKAVLKSSGRHCHPMAGGAPFLTCFNCFELLRLPRRLLHKESSQQKIQCGSCFTIINYAVINKKLVLSLETGTPPIPREVDDSSTERINGSLSYYGGHINRINANFSSDDYDSGYDFQTVDTDPIASSLDQGLNSTKPQENQSFHSTSLSTSEDELSPEVLNAPREVINCVLQSHKPILSPAPPRSPLQEKFDYPSSNHMENRYGKGNRSSRSDQEKVIPNKTTTRQNSMKEVSLATEMDVPFHEYANSGVSHDSGDASREDSRSKSNKGGDSFLANIIKKSFKDFPRFNHIDEHNRKVSVNGHPIPDRVVKKAEKLAGPIHPGNYWYDYKAGFWGVIGGPCLGIIPPSIEEFNYPIPENCAGGNTGVFVNGRELHHKDMELLATRGLPTERDRAYIVDISGRVLDEDTGEELDSLGKLAPTIEKVKHGFGMRVPKAAAS